MARGGRYRHYSSYDAGREAARRHIREAEQFSSEMGGTDGDVKEYFFGLSNKQLEPILVEYGKSHGAAAEAYARETLPNWRSENRRMSGMIAKRLFSLLPPRMPLKKKFELAKNIWTHFGPSSHHSFQIGPSADVESLIERVLEKLDEVVTQYNIPQHVKTRFEWLSAGDVELKEMLLNHFRKIEKKLATEKTRLEIPVLQKQLQDHEASTGLVKSIITVHRHEIVIHVVSDLEDQILLGTPSPAYSFSDVSGSFPWVWIIVAIIVVVVALS